MKSIKRLSIEITFFLLSFRSFLFFFFYARLTPFHAARLCKRSSTMWTSTPASWCARRFSATSTRRRAARAAAWRLSTASQSRCAARWSPFSPTGTPTLPPSRSRRRPATRRRARRSRPSEDRQCRSNRWVVVEGQRMVDGWWLIMMMFQVLFFFKKYNKSFLTSFLFFFLNVLVVDWFVRVGCSCSPCWSIWSQATRATFACFATRTNWSDSCCS